MLVAYLAILRLTSRQKFSQSYFYAWFTFAPAIFGVVDDAELEPISFETLAKYKGRFNFSTR
jgi:hypothetical protein